MSVVEGLSAVLWGGEEVEDACGGRGFMKGGCEDQERGFVVADSVLD